MKTIVIFCESLAFTGPTFEGSEKYWGGYADLLLHLQERGVKAYFASPDQEYLGNGVFSEAFTCTRRVRPEQMQRERFVKADLIFDRGGFEATDVPVMNTPEVVRAGVDKTIMHKLFGELQAYSAVCHNRQQLKKALAKIKTDLVVVKDPTGYGGSGVHIGSRQEVLSALETAAYPLLAQEFMDTSVGIPGLVNGVHDLRIEICGGKIMTGYVRTPKEGEYRANVALGGSVQYVPRNEIPRKAIFLAKRIDAYFRNQPRHYAIDLARTSRGWKMIELNAYPGLIYADYSKETAYIQQTLADYLVKLAGGNQHKMHLPHFSLHLASNDLQAALHPTE